MYNTLALGAPSPLLRSSKAHLFAGGNKWVARPEERKGKEDRNGRGEKRHIKKHEKFVLANASARELTIATKAEGRTDKGEGLKRAGRAG